MFFARINPSRGPLFDQKEQNFRLTKNKKNESQIWVTLIYICKSSNASYTIFAYNFSHSSTIKSRIIILHLSRSVG